MKKNRRIKKQYNVTIAAASHLASVVVMVVVMVIINMLASSNCDQAMERIGKNNKVLAGLKNDYKRELANWEEMKTPERINQALRKHCLAMRPARPEQIVRMQANGEPNLGQYSVAQSRKRNLGKTVQYRKTR